MSNSLKMSEKQGKKGTSTSKAGLEKIKEQHIQLLIKILDNRGYQVRRERLKRGQGWSVQSGAAAVFGEPTIFIDRNLSLEDQLEALIAQLRDQQFVPDKEDLINMPEALLRMFSARLCA